MNRVREINRIIRIRNSTTAPLEPVGWSKCGFCVFRNACWDAAVRDKDIATVPYVDQGAWHQLFGSGVKNYHQLYELSEELLAEIKRPWGKHRRRIGPARARKIKQQIQALKTNRIIMASPPPLPPGYRPGTRPLMMFDLENDVFDPDLGVKVYLWGCLLVKESGTPAAKLIVAGPGVEGDRQGWLDFLAWRSPWHRGQAS